MRRGVVLLVGALAACGESLPPGKCRVTADCVAGEACEGGSSSVIGSCVAIAANCDLSCGEGLECRGSGASSTCALPAGATFGLSVTSPIQGEFLGPRTHRLACANAGVTAERVSFRLRGPGERTRELVGTRDGASFVADWNASSEDDPAGSWNVACIGEAGPAGRGAAESSAELVITLDRSPPGLQHLAPTGWFTASSTAVLQVTATDPSGSGVVTAIRVRSGANVVSATPTGSSATSLEIPVGAWAGTDFEGSLSYVVEAEDGAGNVATSAPYVLQVDTVPPVPTVVAPEAWQARGTVAVTVSVPEGGAPVPEGGAVLRSADDPLVRFISGAGGRRVTVDVDARRLVQPGEERVVSLVAQVVDAAGNVSAEIPVSLRIDASGPVFTVLSANEYFRPGGTVTWRVAVDDVSGVDPSSVGFTRGGAPLECTRPTDSTWRCSFVATGTGPNDTRVAIAMSATDTLGNRRDEEGSVLLDGRGPVVTPVVDRTLYGPDQLVTVDVDIVDGGAGVDTARAPVLQFPGSGAARITGVFVGDGRVRFGPRSGRELFGQRSAGVELDYSGTVTAWDLLGQETSAPVLRSLDFQPPTGAVLDLIYPSTPIAAAKLLRREVDPGRIPQARRDALRLRVRFDDTFTTIEGTPRSSGFSSTPPFLSYTRNDGSEARVEGTADGLQTYAFTFLAGDILMEGPTIQHETTVRVRPLILDGAGNAGGPPPVDLQVTREVAGRQIFGSLSTPPAGGLAIGTDVGYVAIAVDPASTSAPNLRRYLLVEGSLAGLAKVPGLPVGTPVVGASAVWVPSLVGGVATVSGMRPALTQDHTPLFTCTLSGDAMGTPALVELGWDAGVASESLVVPLRDGRLAVVRRNGTGCDVRYDNSFAGADLSRSQVAARGGQLYVTLPNGTVARGTIALGPSSLLAGVSQGPLGPAPVQPSGVALGAGRLFFTSGAQPYFVDVNLGSPLSPSVPGLDAASNVAPVFSGATEVTFAAGNRLVSVATDGTVGMNTVLVSATGAPVTVTAPLLVTESPLGRRTYVATSDRRITARDEDGNVLWARELAAEVTSAMQLGCDGVLHAVTTGGRLHLLVTDSTRTAQTPWPTWQHDVRNTGNADLPLDACGP